MVTATTAGMMALGTMEIGRRTRLRALEPIPGLMAGSMKESGSIITWMVSECTPGKTAGSTVESTRTIRSMGTVSTLGRTDAPTWVTGVEASSTAWALTKYQAHRPRVGYGKRASVSNGLKLINLRRF